MTTQLELFEIEKQIPQWLADYFELANAGNYVGKQSFYTNIKPVVLRTFGQFAGYDLQIIEKKCWTCNGTGVFKHYHHEFGQRYLIKKEQCWNCNNGIYQTKHISLARFILNGKVYHMPAENYTSAISYSNEIRGIIQHEQVDPKEAMRAYIILLWKFNKPAFYDHLKSLVDLEVTSKTKWIRDLIQSLFKKDNIVDELPF